MRIFSMVLLILMILSGCAENRHLRKQSKAQKKMVEISLEYPELFDADTVYQIIEEIIKIPVESVVFDTIVQNNSDTIVVENERIKTVINPIRNISTNEVVRWRIKTEIKQDTIYYHDIDTIRTIHTEIETKTITKKVKYTPWWFWLLVISFLVWFVIGYISAIIDFIKNLKKR